MDIKEAIKIIEEGTVFRCQALCEDESGTFTSTNGMPITRWTRKKIFELAEIVKTKPEGMK